MNINHYTNEIKNLLEDLKALSTDDEIYENKIGSVAHNDIFKVIKKTWCKTKLIKPETLSDFEKKHGVILPELLWFILTEIGYSKLVGSGYVNQNKELYEPNIFMNSIFHSESIKLGASQEIVDEFDSFYNWSNNSFSNSILQKAYSKLGEDSNLLMSKLLSTGHGHCGSTDYILLNDNLDISQYMIVGDGDWATKYLSINNKEYWHWTYGSTNEQFNDYIINNLKNRISYTLQLK